MIRILKFFGVSFLFLLLLYILLLTLPYVAHKKVPQEILDRIRSAKYYSELPGAERAAYIDDNTDALLYRLNLIDQAEKEITSPPSILTWMKPARTSWHLSFPQQNAESGSGCWWTDSAVCWM